MGMRNRIGRIVIAAVVGAAGSLSWGAGFTWTGGTGNWYDPTHWVGGVAPAGSSTDGLAFTGNIFTSTVTAAHDPWVVNGLTFNGSNITIGTSNAAGIQLDGASPFITQLAGAATINSPVVLGQTVTFSMPYNPGYVYTSNISVTMSGPISGAGGLTLNSGDLVLGSANSFTGGVTLNGSSNVSLVQYSNGTFLVAGTLLEVHDNHALGTGAVNLNGDGEYSTLELFANATPMFNNDLNVTGSTNRLVLANTNTSTGATVVMGKLTFGMGNGTLVITPWTGPVSFTNVLLNGNATIGAENTLGCARRAVKWWAGSMKRGDRRR